MLVGEVIDGGVHGARVVVGWFVGKIAERCYVGRVGVEEFVVQELGSWLV